MKDKFFNTIIILVLALLLINCFFEEDRNPERYKIISGSNSPTIMLDQETGETWRNTVCSKDSKVPACWEKMTFLNEIEFHLPIGEQIVRKKEIKLIKQLQKEQAENQEKPEQPAEPTK